MTMIKASLTILLAIGIWCLPASAGAGDATSIADSQRLKAVIAAQSMLGYPQVLDRVDCCCPSTARSSPAYVTLDQQIAALSAALKETRASAKLSPAMIAEGAY